MKCILITGLSGAGKTQALHALEDLGYYCVDNLPPALMPFLLQQLIDNAVERVAIGADIRTSDMLSRMEETLPILEKDAPEMEILFLEASDEELIRRYQETRRTHPMGTGLLLPEAIQKERELLAPIRRLATRILDTNHLRAAQLIALLTRLYSSKIEQEEITVHVVSFGFKQGILQEADMILDVRFLQNPFYVLPLRLLTGRDQPVRDYIFSFPEAHIFMNKTLSLLTFLLPEYSKEGKKQFILGVGCTGGQHRSIALAIELGKGLQNSGYSVNVSHRDH